MIFERQAALARSINFLSLSSLNFNAKQQNSKNIGILKFPGIFFRERE